MRLGIANSRSQIVNWAFWRRGRGSGERARWSDGVDLVDRDQEDFVPEGLNEDSQPRKLSGLGPLQKVIRLGETG